MPSMIPASGKPPPRSNICLFGPTPCRQYQPNGDKMTNFISSEAPLPKSPFMQGPSPPKLPRLKKKRTKLHSQAMVSRFWSKYNSKTPGKVTSIFPQILYKGLISGLDTPHLNKRNASQSYEAARSECLAMVRAAVAQCERTNERFCDTEFDIEADFSMLQDNCLNGLDSAEYIEISSDDDDDYVRPSTNTTSGKGSAPFWPLEDAQKVKQSVRTLRESGLLHNPSINVDVYRLESYIGLPETPKWSSQHRPKSVHRLSWIFESPQFNAGGFSSSDIKQGQIGDCWWLAAVGNIAHRKDLMEKICVERDEECGVYGFVFHRDGEWIPTVIDDNLYLRHEDFGHHSDIYDACGKKARMHKKHKQTGSEALYFSKCEGDNTTWLPLLEKAYAKVHGDYQAIDGGWAGDAVEDLTGGVTTLIHADRVLRKDRLWREMLGVDNESGEFVFGVSAFRDSKASRRRGIILSHAYSVLKAAEIENEQGQKFRLLKIRNPWGQRSESGFGEWHGPWSDGSKEWTPEIIRRLKHEFADDGVFWMSFEDVLSNFKWLHRTRLFGQRWTVAQQWTSESVSWVSGYLRTNFIIEVKQEGLVVVVLSQLDDRYFRGLEGQYSFYLEFILRNTSFPVPLIKARGASSSDKRSVNCEIYLQSGTYEVIPKVTAQRRIYRKTVEHVIKEHVDRKPEKLRAVGLRYDLAHAKAGVLDEDIEQEKKKDEQKRNTKRRKFKQNKLKEMRSAMEKMQLAVEGMQDNLYYKKDKTDDNKEKADDDSKKDTDQADQLHVEEKNKSYGKNGSTGMFSKPLTGYWPGDSVKEPQPDPSKPSKEDSAPTIDNNSDAKPEHDRSAQNNTPNTLTTGSNSKKSPRSAEFDTSQDAPEPQPQPQPQPLPEPLPVDYSCSSSDSDSDSDSSSSSGNQSDFLEERKKLPWNPVCVMCLRVYAQDKDVSVKLVREERKGAKERSVPSD